MGLGRKERKNQNVRNVGECGGGVTRFIVRIIPRPGWGRVVSPWPCVFTFLCCCFSDTFDAFLGMPCQFLGIACSRFAPPSMPLVMWHFTRLFDTKCYTRQYAQYTRASRARRSCKDGKIVRCCTVSSSLQLVCAPVSSCLLLHGHMDIVDMRLEVGGRRRARKSRLSSSVTRDWQK